MWNSTGTKCPSCPYIETHDTHAKPRTAQGHTHRTHRAAAACSSIPHTVQPQAGPQTHQYTHINTQWKVHHTAATSHVQPYPWHAQCNTTLEKPPTSVCPTSRIDSKCELHVQQPRGTNSTILVPLERPAYRATGAETQPTAPCCMQHGWCTQQNNNSTYQLTEIYRASFYAHTSAPSKEGAAPQGPATGGKTNLYNVGFARVI